MSVDTYLQGKKTAGYRREHVDDDRKTAAEMVRVTRPGGIIVAFAPNRLYPFETHGAYVGDVLTSVIETCRLNGVNPLAYLTALMENRSAVFAAPGAWLPWNYQENLDGAAPTWPLSHPPPVLGQSGRLGVAVPQ